MERRELVYALCHEVGNLLAAVRLHAHFVAAESDPEELEVVKLRISEASGLAGALLAQVRPLLCDAATDRLSVDPKDLVEGLLRSLDPASEARVRVRGALDDARRGGAALPPIRVEPDTLHHILLTAVLTALQGIDAPDGPTLSVKVAKERVAFAVEYASPFEEADDEAPPRGAPLMRAIADTLLRDIGGELSAAALSPGQRLEYWVPMTGAGRS